MSTLSQLGQCQKDIHIGKKGGTTREKKGKQSVIDFLLKLVLYIAFICTLYLIFKRGIPKSVWFLSLK